LEQNIHFIETRRNNAMENKSLLYPCASAARRVISLDGMWRFEFDPESNGMDAGWGVGLPKPISMPVPASFCDFFTDKESREYCGDFYGCGIALGDLTDSTLAAQLQEYLPQSAEGTTKTIDADGNVTFCGLELGLYLIVQTEASKGYEPINPFLVSLPMAEDGKWNYAVDASPKVGAYTPTKPDTPPTPPTPPTPDYPDTPTPPNNPDNPVSPGNPDNPVAPGHPDHPVAPGNPDSPVLPGHPDNPVMSGLPQTGQLNWPVPVLAVSGVVLFAFGWALDRKYRTV